MYTEAINHDPAITFMNTGNQQPGYASMGAWISYGLGSENENLPTFIAMVSQGSGKNPGQPIFSRLWGSGFLPSSHQGVGLRPGANPVLYLDDPPGTTREQRRALLDDLAQLNELRAARAGRSGDARSHPRVRDGVSDADFGAGADGSVATSRRTSWRRTGREVRKPGSYAANCLLARRLLERDVRFVQLFHRGWDQHIAIERQLPNQCRDVDQPTAALLNDLKQRGLLEDTLVMFLTEFGRTVFSQGQLGDPGMGRDHHGRCFTVWLAGAGVQHGHRIRQDRRLLLQHRRESGPSARSARHDAAHPGHRSRAVHVSVPRARREADGRGRGACGEGDIGLAASRTAEPRQQVASLLLPRHCAADRREGVLIAGDAAPVEDAQVAAAVDAKRVDDRGVPLVGIAGADGQPFGRGPKWCVAVGQRGHHGLVFARVQRMTVETPGGTRVFVESCAVE